MSSSSPQSALDVVREARERAERDEHERRRSPSVEKAAEKRVTTLRARGRVGRFLFENSLSIAAIAFFVVSFAGQVLAGHRAHNEEGREHGQPAITLTAYLRSGDFVEATAENWESEFLQMGLFVLLTAFLYQRGSSESKTIEEPDPVDQRPEEARDDEDAPGPVRRGGAALWLYKHSLSIALFALFVISFGMHAIGGAEAYSEEQEEHGAGPVSVLAYIATTHFWFESFQNWQSEFLSVGVLVLFSIWLREQGSSQSKPVAAAHSDTGE